MDHLLRYTDTRQCHPWRVDQIIATDMVTIGDLRDYLRRSSDCRTLSVISRTSLVPRCPRSVDIAVGGRVEGMKGYNDPRDMRVQCPLDNKLWRYARFSNFEYHYPV